MDRNTVAPIVVTVSSETGRFNKNHQAQLTEKRRQAEESNLPFVAVRNPNKYAKVTCRMDTMGRRFYSSAIDELDQIYQEYKNRLENDSEHQSHPVFNGSKGHEWVHVTDISQPYADELAGEFADVAADLSNSTTQSLPFRQSRF